MAGKQLKAAPPAETRDWVELPEDILSVIFKKIGGIDVLWHAQGVCRTWRKLALQTLTWRCIDMRVTYGAINMDHMAALARTAIDRSDGLVVEFRAEWIGDDALLQYIAERTTGLRVLALDLAYHVSAKGLVEFVRRCTLLEELHIIDLRLVEGTCADIGRALPNLKRFVLGRSWFQAYADPKNFYALEVADTMTQLKELQLIDKWICNDAVHTILDKCSNLESLDIGGCFRVRLDDGLKTKLANVKKVRLPYDPTTDCVFPNNLDFDDYLDYLDLDSRSCLDIDPDDGFDYVDYDDFFDMY